MNKPKIVFQQATHDSALELYIYDAVMPSGYDWWTGEEIESETSAEYFRQKLAEYPNVMQINLYINSPGGSVMEGYGIYAQLKRHPAKVTVYVDGFACSVASVIAMAADHIVMYSNSMMMIHNAEDWVCGNAEQLRKAADSLDKLMEGNRQAYLTKAGDRLTEETLIKLLNAETWLTAQDCLSYGLCDEISGLAIDENKANTVMQRMTNTLQQRVALYKGMQRAFADLNQVRSDPAPNPEPAPAPAPAPEPTPDPQPNIPQQLMAALFG